MDIHDFVMDPQYLLALEPEEVAVEVLKYLDDCETSDSQQLNSHNFFLNHTGEGCSRELQEEFGRALREAWRWLEDEGYLAPRPGVQDGWFDVTPRGKCLVRAANRPGNESVQKLARRMLNPSIAQQVWELFLLGDFDKAVLHAFEEVEVAVRKECGYRYPPEEIGTTLMRKAFHKDGPLTDRTLPDSEREAMADLFAGAVGLYKNPHSHHMHLEADETVDLLILASHLLLILDRRAGTGEA